MVSQVQRWGRKRVFTHPKTGEKVCVIPLDELRTGDRIVTDEAMEVKAPRFTAPLLAHALTPVRKGMVEIYAVFEDGQVIKKEIPAASFYIVSASDS